VPSAKVRGQTVTLTARYLRLRTQSVEITLVGGSMVRDFDLVSPETPDRSVPRAGTDPAPVPSRDFPRSAGAPTPATRDNAPATSPAISPAAPSPGRVVAAAASRLLPSSFSPIVDSTAFMDVAGPTTIASILSGRLACAATPASISTQRHRAALPASA